MPTLDKDIAFTRYGGSRGIAWLAEGYAMFRRNRLPWIGLLLAYYLTLLVVDAVPWIGPFVAAAIKPVLSVGFLAAAWTQERGGKPALRMMLRGFGANLTALLPLGLVFVAGISLAIGATSLIDGGRLLDLLYGVTPADTNVATATQHVQQTLMAPRVQLAMLFGVLCAMPTILALWWAPALVVFQDARLTVALRTSLRAALANWRPAARYAIGVFLMGAVVPSFITTAIALIVPPPFSATLAVALVVPYMAFFVAALHISDYISYRDVFHAGETLTPIA